MKLIIDIPDNEYKHIREYNEKNDIVEATYSHIYNGIPLDKIRAEIDGIEINGQVDEHTLFIRGAEEVKKMALNIIDRYRRGNDE